MGANEKAAATWHTGDAPGGVVPLRVLDVADAPRRAGAIGWCGATYGSVFDLIRLDRAPRDDRERVWVTEILPTRLAPGGVIGTVQPPAHEHVWEGALCDAVARCYVCGATEPVDDVETHDGLSRQPWSPQEDA